jgi:hypothetical protein
MITNAADALERSVPNKILAMADRRLGDAHLASLDHPARLQEPLLFEEGKTAKPCRLMKPDLSRF